MGEVVAMRRRKPPLWARGAAIIVMPMLIASVLSAAFFAALWYGLAEYWHDQANER